MKEIEQMKAKFSKFVEKQLETNEMIEQIMAEMAQGFELIRQTTQGMVEQCKAIQEITAHMVQQFKSIQQINAKMVQEQINNTQSLINDMFPGTGSEEVCDGRPFSRDDSPVSPTQTPPTNAIPPIPQIPLEPTSDTAVTEKTSENREEHGGSVLVDPSTDAMAPPSLDNRVDQGDRSRADSISDAIISPQISEKPEEQFDREDFSSFVDTSPRGTLSRMDSLTTLAQMKSMAEEVHQMNLTAADSPASPPPSYSCESLSSCLKSSPIAFGTQPFASVDYDETAKEDTIKICFSLKGENNLFQSTPKQINGYRFSLFVQCNKSPTKLLLGLFIKCRGPADGVGVGVPATVRIHPPVFIVHNCKGKDDVKMQAKSSMKFEPPYESSSGGGVWIELDGKQELINKGLITENELNIQVSASLEFHNPGSVTSLDI